MSIELHQILENIRVQVITHVNEKQEQIHASISETYKRDIEPDQITYTLRVLNDMVDRCESVEETIDLLKARHKEVCAVNAKTK